MGQSIVEHTELASGTGPCFPTDKTPLWAKASFSGVELCPQIIDPIPSGPSDPILLRLQNLPRAEYYGILGDFECWYTGNTGSGSVLDLFWQTGWMFRGWNPSSCSTNFINHLNCGAPDLYGTGGYGSIMYVPEFSGASVLNVCSKLNIAAQPGTVYEFWPRDSEHNVIKLCRLTDATRIHTLIKPTDL